MHTPQKDAPQTAWLTAQNAQSVRKPLKFSSGSSTQILIGGTTEPAMESSVPLLFVASND